MVFLARNSPVAIYKMAIFWYITRSNGGTLVALRVPPRRLPCISSPCSSCLPPAPRTSSPRRCPWSPLRPLLQLPSPPPSPRPMCGHGRTHTTPSRRSATSRTGGTTWRWRRCWWSTTRTARSSRPRSHPTPRRAPRSLSMTWSATSSTETTVTASSQTTDATARSPLRRMASGTSSPRSRGSDPRRLDEGHLCDYPAHPRFLTGRLASVRMRGFCFYVCLGRIKKEGLRLATSTPGAHPNRIGGSYS